jgi:nicotinamidase-related amidase
MKDRKLLVIDLQPAFKVEPYYSKILEYINSNKDKYSEIVATRFVSKPGCAIYDRLGFDKAVKKENLEFEYDYLIGKSEYSVFYGLLKERFQNSDVDIVGCDTDACVLATCYTMFEHNLDFKVLSDYCYSSGGKTYHSNAIKIIKRNFGKNSVV